MTDSTKVKDNEVEDKVIVRKAKEYAIKSHEETNHKYDKIHGYEYHLSMVAQIALKYNNLVQETYKSTVIAAAWCHDVIEDCRQTYNDVKKATEDEVVANIVYACTNEKGRTRKERANEKFYDGLRKEPLAIFVKLCDRIANVEYSKDNGNNMFTVYYSENANFVEQVYMEEYKPMIDHLNSLFEHLENI